MRFRGLSSANNFFLIEIKNKYIINRNEKITLQENVIPGKKLARRAAIDVDHFFWVGQFFL